MAGLNCRPLQCQCRSPNPNCIVFKGFEMQHALFIGFRFFFCSLVLVQLNQWSLRNRPDPNAAYEEYGAYQGHVALSVAHRASIHMLRKSNIFYMFRKRVKVLNSPFMTAQKHEISLSQRRLAHVAAIHFVGQIRTRCAAVAPSQNLV